MPHPTANPAPSVRLAHLSDIHVAVAGCRWRGEDWLNKRFAAWLNLRVLGRARHFRHVEPVLAALAADLARRAFDHVIFSGDATALGFEEEVARAAELLGVGRPGGLPGLAVPGNHDYCTRRAAASGCFERYFAPWQQGERVDGAVYPFAQRVGPAWLVGVNSASANRWAWDARGRVGDDQLRRLEALLARLGDGPRVLVTHYPVLTARGRRERPGRRLRDLDALLAVAHRGGIRLWLHGHRHGPYHHPAGDAVAVPAVCAGSATQSRLWSYGDYQLTAGELRVSRRVYDPVTQQFRDGPSCVVALGG